MRILKYITIACFIFACLLVYKDQFNTVIQSNKNVVIRDTISLRSKDAALWKVEIKFSAPGPEFVNDIKCMYHVILTEAFCELYCDDVIRNTPSLQDKLKKRTSSYLQGSYSEIIIEKIEGPCSTVIRI